MKYKSLLDIPTGAVAVLNYDLHGCPKGTIVLREPSSWDDEGSVLFTFPGRNFSYHLDSTEFTLLEDIEQPRIRGNKMKVPYEQVVELLEGLNSIAEEAVEHLGLPLFDCDCMRKMVDHVVRSLNLQLDEDPKISAIMNHTGCSREQAIALIESGEI